MKLYVGIILFFLIICIHGKELEEGKVYRLNKTIRNLHLVQDSAGHFVAAINSKFKVVSVSDDYYVVSFVTKPTASDTNISVVGFEDEYKLSRKYFGVPIEKSVSLYYGGAVGGPLVVPFKYRVNSNSLSGEASVGYYLGYGWEPKIPFRPERFLFSPFVAGGLSQINVSVGEETMSQTGVTLAVGVLLQNWAGVNIGLLYGQDRIGNTQWEHEGKGWYSFMIGWSL